MSSIDPLRLNESPELRLILPSQGFEREIIGAIVSFDKIFTL